MLTTIKPTFDRILVRPAKKKEKAGRIVIPDAAQEPQTEGEVVAVGPGHWAGGVFIPMSISVGQTVHYGEYHGVEIKVGDETYKILAEGEVLAVIERSSLVLPS